MIGTASHPTRSRWFTIEVNRKRVGRTDTRVNARTSAPAICANSWISEPTAAIVRPTLSNVAKMGFGLGGSAVNSWVPERIFSNRLR